MARERGWMQQVRKPCCVCRTPTTSRYVNDDSAVQPLFAEVFLCQDCYAELNALKSEIAGAKALTLGRRATFAYPVGPLLSRMIDEREGDDVRGVE